MGLKSIVSPCGHAAFFNFGRKDNEKTKLLGTTALVLSLTTTSVASAQTLTMGVRGGPESMDPHYSALGPHAEAAKHIFDTLVWSGTDLQIEPGLATSWSPVDEDTWEFKLRKGVKFHDGSDFDAEDVYDNDEYLFVSNYSCKNCNASYEVCHGKKENE